MADELEVKVFVTRKASSDHGGADYVVGTVSSTMGNEDRLRFLAYLAKQYGEDPSGQTRTTIEAIAAYWEAVSRTTAKSIEQMAKAEAARAAAEAVTPVTVTVSSEDPNAPA